MAEWEELAQENLDAAKMLYERRYFRSCISRAYYAAYAGATAEFVQRASVSFGRRENPTHAQLPMLIADGLDPKRFRREVRRQLARQIRFLRRCREIADYVPAESVDRSLALTCLRHASSVFHRLSES